MIPTQSFGATGHASTRILFGAAAVGGMKQAAADRVLDLLLEHGVNHIDTAASYGESELRIGPWMREHRDRFFLATKTGERSGEGARESLHRSLERLRVDSVDLIQLHNLADEPGWEQAHGPGGAVEALVEARAQGLVRFIGVTGHGTWIAHRHLQSLSRFAYDSVLLPYNFSMMQNAEYAADFETLVALCQERQVAVQGIKAIARRRWREGGTERRFSWYEPLREPDALRRAVHWALARPGVFLNTTSDATLLPQILEAAAKSPIEAPLADAMQADIDGQGIEPLFVRGVSDDVRLGA